MELLGCSGVRFEVLWGSLWRLLRDNREKLDFDDHLVEFAMFWIP